MRGRLQGRWPGREGRGRCVGLMGFVAHVAFMSFAFNLIAFLWVRHKIKQHRKEERGGRVGEEERERVAEREGGD